MRFLTLIVGLLMSAIICLAQADSAIVQDPDTVFVGEATAPVGKADKYGRKWILGFEVNNLDLKSFPGITSLQRKITPRLFVSSGVTIQYNRDKPGEYCPSDSTRINSEGISWDIALRPEVGYMLISRDRFAGGISLRAGMRRMRNWSLRETRDERQYYYYYSNYYEWNQMDYGLSLPVFIEREFTIRKVSFSVGVISEMLSISSGWMKDKSRSTLQSWYNPEPVVEENERKQRLPVYMNLKNPFQEYVRVFVKFHL